MNRNQLIEAYKTASNEIQKIANSLELSERLNIMATTYGLGTPSKLITIVGDVILGFHKTTDLPKLFQEQLLVGADQAQRMTADLLEFLSPVIEREEQEAREQVVKKKTAVNGLQNTIATANNQPEEAEPITTVKPLNASEPETKRALSHGAYSNNKTDVEEPIIASNQESLLRPATKAERPLPEWLQGATMPEKKPVQPPTISTPRYTEDE